MKSKSTRRGHEVCGGRVARMKHDGGMETRWQYMANNSEQQRDFNILEEYLVPKYGFLILYYRHFELMKIWAR